MLHEFEERRQILCREVAELRQRRETCVQELARISQEFDHGSAQLEEATARLRALNTRLAVTERRLKEARTETSLLRRRRSDVSQEALSLKEQFEALEVQQLNLLREREELGEKIAAIESASAEILKAVEAAAAQKRQVQAGVEEYESKGEELSREIAQMLSVTASEREGIDGELNDITLMLMGRIADRESVQTVLDERAPAMAALREGVFALDQRRQALEAAKTLESRRTSLHSAVLDLKKELEAIERCIEDHQKLRTARQEKLDELAHGNPEKVKAIADLEARVGPYDELASKIKDAEPRLVDLLRSNESRVKDIEELFGENMRLERAFRQLEERLKAMVQLTGSLIVEDAQEVTA